LSTGDPDLIEIRQVVAGQPTALVIASAIALRLAHGWAIRRVFRFRRTAIAVLNSLDGSLPPVVVGADRAIWLCRGPVPLAVLGLLFTPTAMIHRAGESSLPRYCLYYPSGDARSSLAELRNDLLISAEHHARRGVS